MFTNREKDVLELLCKGYTNIEIGENFRKFYAKFGEDAFVNLKDFFEQKIIESKNSSLKAEKNLNNTPQKLNSYEAKETIRTSTGFEELDRVLGGGLVKGSLILLGGIAVLAYFSIFLTDDKRITNK